MHCGMTVVILMVVTAGKMFVFIHIIDDNGSKRPFSYLSLRSNRSKAPIGTADHRGLSRNSAGKTPFCPTFPTCVPKPVLVNPLFVVWNWLKKMRFPDHRPPRGHLDLQDRTLQLPHHPARRAASSHFLVSFPYGCPEPVLVK